MSIDWSKPVRTKEGRAVRLFATDANGTYPIVGQIGDDTDVSTWTKNGCYWGASEACRNDLENVPDEPVTQTKWLNMMRTDAGAEYGVLHDDMVSAQKHGEAAPGSTCIARIAIPYTEGQFDDKEWEQA